MRPDNGPTDGATTADRIGDASFVELIEQVSAATWRAQSPAEAVAAALHGICEWAGWPVGHAYRAGQTADDPLRPTTIWHLADPDRFAEFRRVTEATALSVGVGLLGRSMASGRPAWIADATREPSFPQREACLRAGLRGAFEITETAAIANMETARSFADRLTALGCRFALDDFGAGFSSFYYLKYLPLSYLKIDGDFIRALTSSVTDQLVVQSMVEIARGMGMKTIAEFVEMPATAEMLHAKGVDYSQGYYHGRPQPIEEALAAPDAAPKRFSAQAQVR